MIVYFSFLLLSIIWLIILVTGPYLLSHGFENNIIISLYYTLFKLICHQKPDRSYFLWGYQIPVCVRCTGVYVGIIVGAVVYPAFKKLNSTKIPNIKYLIFFTSPIIIDGLAQTFYLYPSPHYVRLLTGIWASCGLVFWILPLLNQFYNKLFLRE